MAKSKKNSDSWLDNLAAKDIRVQKGEIKLVSETGAEKKKHWLKNRLTTLSLLGLFLIVVGWIVASMLLPKIRIGDNLVSARLSDASLQKIISQRSSTYRVALIYPNGIKKSFS